MLGWLKKLAGGKAFTNKAGLDAKSLELLSNDFGRLEQLSPELAEGALRYVLDGEADPVLDGLAGLIGAARILELHCVQSYQQWGEQTDRRQFFQNVRCSDPGLFIRLGRVYEAISSRVPRQVAEVFGDPALIWLEILLLEATQCQMNMWPRRCRKCSALDAPMIEAMLTASGHAPEVLIRSAFQPKTTPYFGASFEPVFLSLGGFDQSVVRHRSVVVAAIQQPDFKQRLYALELMAKAKVPPEPFLEELVTLALGTSKQVREVSESLLAAAKPAVRPLLERKIVEGSNDERAAATRLLWAWEKEAARDFLTARLPEEQNKKVRQVIETVLSVTTPAVLPEAATIQLPALAPVSAEEPLGPETRQAWEECLQKVNAGIEKVMHAVPVNQRHLKPLSPDGIEKAFQRLQSGSVKDPTLGSMFQAWYANETSQPFKEFWQRPELKLIHLVRFVFQVGGLRIGRQDEFAFGYGGWLEMLFPHFRRTHPDVGLRELGAACAAVGFDSRQLGQGLLASYRETPFPLGLPPELIWPYWAEHMNLLEKTFLPSSSDRVDRYFQRGGRRNALHALATFPQVPPLLVAPLWSMALGPKNDRGPAQRCLAPLPDKLERLVTSLQTGDLDTRIAAVDWMGRLGDARGVEILLAALKREKQEVVKGAIMAALERLDVPVDQFLDRKGLLKEAEKGVAKGPPEDLKWFPFGQLPPVHWSDNGQQVDPVVLQWWLMQGFKLKNPEPGALLRRYCASIDASEREALGQFVLEAWLGRDTSPRTGTDAEKEAMKRAQGALTSAQQLAQYLKQNPTMAQYYGALPAPKTLEEHYAEILPIVLREPTGSAIASKGVLALAGACVGSGAAPLVNRYLKDWYGMRAAQCRALLQMLAWVEHKTATQLLLAVGSRFRTKGIQEEANKQALAIAERKGWSVAELADRTIPSAGLDETGTLTLDFGSRQFTARLNEDLDFVLSDADGKTLKSLPEPRRDDDEARAAEAKKTYSAAKKELKSVLTMQRDRLYEAMCTQRTWPFEDWNVYLNRHPIARHHCQRLVWSVVREGKVTGLFRPLADGTLTDAADDTVTLTSKDEIRVAHECQVTPEQSLAWRQHLKDYDVAPLFEQFGRPNFEVTEDRKQEDELKDFRGHVLEAFKLRGRATKLGYTRGQAQDGGWFYDYHKRFPTLGLMAVLEFTGNSLPEENRTIALSGFHFQNVGDGESQFNSTKLPLGEVPAVLLGECWNDFRQIAAEGPGFDPEWEKKCGA